MQSKFKPCPFCGNFPNVEFDTEIGQYKLECKKCKEKGIIYYCIADSIKEVINKWNTRLEKENIVINKKELVRQNINPTIDIQDSYGFLIFPDGEILICDMYDHQEIIMKRFNIKESKDTFDHTSYCGKNGIIRISIFKGSLAIDLPIKITKKQKDHIFEALAVYPDLKHVIKFSIFSYKTKQYLIFYTIDELLEALDNV